jgi:hypothetical protein
MQLTNVYQAMMLSGWWLMACPHASDFPEHMVRSCQKHKHRRCIGVNCKHWNSHNIYKLNLPLHVMVIGLIVQAISLMFNLWLSLPSLLSWSTDIIIIWQTQLCSRTSILWGLPFSVLIGKLQAHHLIIPINLVVYWFFKGRTWVWLYLGQSTLYLWGRLPVTL